MIKKVIPNSFMVILEDLIMMLIIMMRNLILCGVIVLGKIMRQSMIIAITQANIEGLQFEIQNATINFGGFGPWFNIWLPCYNQTPSRRAIQMFRKNQYKAFSIPIEKQENWKTIYLWPVLSSLTDNCSEGLHKL